MDPGTYIALVARLESIAQHIAHTQTQTQSPSTSTSDQSEWTEAQGHLKIIADGLREEPLRKRLSSTSLPSLLSTFLRLSISLPPLSSSSTSLAPPSDSEIHSPDDPSAPPDLTQSIENLAIVEAKGMEKMGWVQETRNGVDESGLQEEREGVVKEVGRVAANLVFEDDENRSTLMTYQYPSSTFQVFASYLRFAGDADRTLSSANVGTLRALVASVLNCVLGEYDAIKLFILQPPTLSVLLQLANIIYQPCQAIHQTEQKDEDGMEDKAIVSGWMWKILEECMSAENAAKLLTPSAIPLLLTPFPPFSLSTSSTAASASSDSRCELIRNLRNTDLQILTTASQTLEGLSLDRPDLLDTMMREDHLKVIVQFVEEGEVMEEWFGQGEADEDEQEDEEEEEADEEQEDGKDIATAIPSAVSTQTRKPSTPRERAEKAIGMSKACMMKVLVEICGECTMSVKESWFQTKLLRWIESASKSESENLSESKGKGKAVDGNRERGTEQGLERDDLLCCGLLCMGNSARSESISSTLLPLLLPTLLPLLRPSTDPKIQHALLGLLKNLSIPSVNKIKLGEAGVVEGVVGMGVLGEGKDLLGSIQGGGVGLLKHLAVGNVPNCLKLMTPDSLTNESSITNQLLSLISRSDDLAIKCESARVFVNVIKTLYSSNNNPSTPGSKSADDKNKEEVVEDRVQAAKDVVENEKVVDALLGMVASAGKYSVLIGEGVLALNLLCRTKGGLRSVTETILKPSAPTSSHLTKTLIPLLQPPSSTSTENPPLPTEIKSNVYLLLITIHRLEGVSDVQGYVAGKEKIGKMVKETEGEVQGKEQGMMSAVGKAWGVIH